MSASERSTPDQTLAVATKHRLLADDPNGFACGLGAFVLWGILPLYWRLLSGVASLEIVGHRIIWSFLLLTLIIKPQLKRTWEPTHPNLPPWTRKFWPVLGIYLAAAVLISINWYVFIWAVETHQVVEAYFGLLHQPAFECCDWCVDSA